MRLLRGVQDDKVIIAPTISATRHDIVGRGTMVGERKDDGLVETAIGS